jgi:hypothetical protein
MLTRFAEWQGREPESVAADTTYGNGEFLQWLADRGTGITRSGRPKARSRSATSISACPTGLDPDIQQHVLAVVTKSYTGKHRTDLLEPPVEVTGTTPLYSNASRRLALRAQTPFGMTGSEPVRYRSAPVPQGKRCSHSAGKACPSRRGAC